MKEFHLTQTNCTLLAGAIAVAAIGISLASCTKNSSPVLEADYSTQIIGHWQGTVGNLKETMSIDRDGTFVCQTHPGGFIGNTLSQGVTRTVRGTWQITGAIITLKITAETKERLENKAASSTIVAFTDNELVLKSDRGETSTFQRVRSL